MSEIHVPSPGLAAGVRFLLIYPKFQTRIWLAACDDTISESPTASHLCSVSLDLPAWLAGVKVVQLLGEWDGSVS